MSWYSELNLLYNADTSKAQKKIKELNNSVANLTKDANRSGSSMNGLGKAIGGFNMALGTAKIIAFSGSLATLTNSAMDMIEQTNLFNVAMGDMAEEADKNIQAMHDLYGFDVTNMRTAVGTFALLARSMGMTTEQASILAQNTQKLAVDYSSLTNIPIQQVMQDFRSGLVGQSETVYKYGMDVTEAGLKTEAMKQGITKSVREMSQGEKMALRYSVMIRQSALAQGDFARTINTPANQLKILSERITSCGRAIGTIFIPMLTVVLPYLNAFVSIVTDVANAIASLFGYVAPQASNTVKNGMLDMGDGANDATDAIGGTTKALKEMKDATLGIDELNIMPKPTTGAGGAGGDGGGASILGDMKLPSFDNLMSSIQDTTTALKEQLIKALEKVLLLVNLIGIAFMAWQIAEAIFGVGMLAGALTAIKSLVGDIVAFFQLVKEFGFAKTLADLFPVLNLAIKIFGVLAGAFFFVQGIMDMIKDNTTKGLTESLGGLALMAITIGTKFGIMGAVITLAIGGIILLASYIYKLWKDSNGQTDVFAKKLSDFISSIPEKLGYIIGYVVAWASKLVVSIFNALVEAVVQLIKFVLEIGKRILEAVNTGNFGDIGNAIVAGIIDGINKYPIIEGIINFIKGFVQGFKDVLGIHSPSTLMRDEIGFNMVAGISEGILGFDIFATLKTFTDSIMNFFTTTFPNIVNTVVGFFSSMWDRIKLIWSTVSQWFGDNVGTPLKNVFYGVVNGIIGMFNGLITGFESAVNFIINGINKLANYVNGLISDYNSNNLMLPDINFKFGTVKPITLGRIPALASGGSLGKGDIFQAGEFGKAELLGSYGGKTTVMPLENTDFVQSIYEAVKSAMSEVDLSGQVIDNALYLDGEKIYASQKKIERNRGVNLGMGVFAR